MSDLAEFLATVDPFSQLPRPELVALAERVEVVELPAGTPLFARGDAGDRAYVVVEGVVEVTAPGPVHPIVLAMCGPGELVGEAALIRETTRNATVSARTDVRLLAIGAEDLRSAVGKGAGALVQTILDRWDATRDSVMRAERMAQLGTLAAGIAHELNNPAAAVRRSAEILTGVLQRLDAAALAVAGLEGEREAAVRTLQVEVAGRDKVESGALERMDMEEELALRLQELGVQPSHALAGDALGAGLEQGDVERLAAHFSGDELSGILALVVASSSAKGLAGEIGWAAAHMSDIARDLGQYSRLGEAPVQDVDLREGIEHTLRLVAHRLEGIEVKREFAPDLPTVTGSTGELNQVWTNLLANAADATGPGGTIIVRAFAEDDSVVVEIEDDGSGISDADLARIFDPFFTTKPPGSGTGLGLPISHKIVVADHRGDLTVDSRPGRTVFRVMLPIDRNS